MLKSLSIKNLALIEDAQVTFGQGFNVITGETGSGKSSFLSALRFALGQRADSAFVRKGAEKASILAVFERSELKEVLDAIGIEAESAEVIIKREISAAGTSRAFINNQPVLLSTLETVAQHLINFASQQAQSQLLNREAQRAMLDSYAEASLESYQKSWAALTEALQEKKRLEGLKYKRERLLKELHDDLKLLERRALLEQEAEIFARFSYLETQKEEREQLEKLHDALFSPDKNFLTLLHRFLTIKQDALAVSLKNIHAEVADLSYTLDQLLSDRGESNDSLAEKLKVIDRIKAKWPPEECEKAFSQVKEQIQELEEIDTHLEEVQDTLNLLQETLQKEADLLSQKRKASAETLEKKVTEHLHSLNMPKALFHVELVPTALSSQGQETIEFMLTANEGERKTPLKGFASGGELSRLLLAIKTVLAGPRPVLIFDEIDAAIGGVTASLVADKIKKMAERYQVICITHLPQMAEQAAHHLVIEKFNEEGRTFTKVFTLNEKERKKELKRMLGTQQHPLHNE